MKVIPMFATTHSRAHRHPRGARAPALVGLALLLLIPTAARGQADTDDDGVLPAQQHTHGTPQQATAPGLVIAGELFEIGLDPKLASVVLDFEGTVQLVPTSEADDAHAAPVGGTLRAASEIVADGESQVTWQGEGALDLDAVGPGPDATLTAASAPVLRNSALFMTDGSAATEQVLDGEALPLAIDVLGDLSALDLRQYRQAVEAFGAAYPGLEVTLVMVSAESGGPMHMIAVTASTDGGPLRISMR